MAVKSWWYGSGAWRETKYMAVYVAGVWRQVAGLWIWQDPGGGYVWIQCYDNTPGPVTTVIVSPSNPTVASPGSQQFTAQGFDTYGRLVSGATFTWTKIGFHATINASTGLLTTTAGALSGSVEATCAQTGTIGSESYTV